MNGQPDTFERVLAMSQTLGVLYPPNMLLRLIDTSAPEPRVPGTMDPDIDFPRDCPPSAP